MLTKKYQLIYNAKSKVILDVVAYEGQETNVPKGLSGKDFDSLEEKEEFITNNNLINDEPTN